jgi:hypothetical protein
MGGPRHALSAVLPQRPPAASTDDVWVIEAVDEQPLVKVI